MKSQRKYLVGLDKLIPRESKKKKKKEKENRDSDSA